MRPWRMARILTKPRVEGHQKMSCWGPGKKVCWGPADDESRGQRRRQGSGQKAESQTPVPGPPAGDSEDLGLRVVMSHEWFQRRQMLLDLWLKRQLVAIWVTFSPSPPLPPTHCTACGMVVPWPGAEFMSPTLGEQSLNHWTVREVPELHS